MLPEPGTCEPSLRRSWRSLEGVLEGWSADERRRSGPKVSATPY